MGAAPRFVKENTKKGLFILQDMGKITFLVNLKSPVFCNIENTKVGVEKAPYL